MHPNSCPAIKDMKRKKPKRKLVFEDEDEEETPSYWSSPEEGPWRLASSCHPMPPPQEDIRNKVLMDLWDNSTQWPSKKQ